MLEWLRQVLANHNDALGPYRQHVVMKSGVAAVTLLAPFTIYHLFFGHPGIAAVAALIQLAVAADLVAIRKGKEAPVPYSFIVGGMVVGMLTAVFIRGIAGALWGYAVILIGYFLLSRRVAFLYSLTVLVSLPAAIALRHEGGLAVRVFATLLLTILLVNYALDVIAQLQEALVQQTITDPLTGLYNRRHMARSLELVVEQGRRREPRNALLALDIDHFKSINDRFGHTVGDEVLRRLAQVVSARKRKVDLFFRTGGEEFVVLLYDVDTPTAAQVAEDIRRLVEQARLVDASPVTVSIGVASQRVGEAAESWVQRADQALYRAKHTGRNRVELPPEPTPDLQGDASSGLGPVGGSRRAPRADA